MGYVLGSQVESMAFTDHGVEYQPAGAAHAVDLHAAVNAPGGLVGYALCGVAVRIWRDCRFEANAPHAHRACAALTAAAEISSSS